MHRGFGTSKKCNSTLLFSSRNIEYKKPFGAAKTNQKVEITFPVSGDFSANGVALILRRNEAVKKINLERTGNENGYDIFKTVFSIDRSGTYFYRFEIEKQNALCFVGRGDSGTALIQDWLPEWQLSVYDESYEVPATQNGGVIYHIFADRFCKAGESRSPMFGVLKEWDEDITIIDSDGSYRANDFYGGNFQGIISKLDYLSELGITMIYLSPVFESNSNHRYDTGDYSKIDYLLGDEEDFIELIEKAKAKDISVMLDGVFNHTGADSKYFNKFGHYPSIGAYQSKDSKYYDWYTFKTFPDEYDCWWGITVVPTVSRNATGYQNMIAGRGGVIEKWTKLGVKGWRLDVVDELSSGFVEKIRNAVKENDKDALVIGEVWEDASTKYSYDEERKYFRGKELDGVMNYPFRKAILDYLNYPSAKIFIERVASICENYPAASLNSCMTLLDSHDTLRAINALAKIDIKNTTKQERKDYRFTVEEYNKAKQKLKLASTLQYFLPGIPSVYYGDEIGMQGFEDPINRRPFDYKHIDSDLLSHYQKLGKIRKEYKEEFSGCIEDLYSDGEVLFIKRKSLMLIANPLKTEYQLDKGYYDILTERTLSAVSPKTALLYLI